MDIIERVSKEDLQRLWDWATVEESRYPSMTYEQGIQYTIELVLGHITLDELMGA